MRWITCINSVVLLRKFNTKVGRKFSVVRLKTGFFASPLVEALDQKKSRRNHGCLRVTAEWRMFMRLLQRLENLSLSTGLYAQDRSAMHASDI